AGTPCPLIAKKPISRQASSIRAATARRSARPPWRAGVKSIRGTSFMAPPSEGREDRAAVDDERLAGHERAVVGSEEDHGALHVVAKGLALERARLHDGRHL